MRRVAVVLLALVAAFASPLRQACGTTCIEPSVSHARVEVAAVEPAAACHKPEAPPEPEPAPAHCSHDHSDVLRLSARTVVDLDSSPSIFVGLWAPIEIHALAPADVVATREPPGSPPFLRNTPLRV